MHKCHCGYWHTTFYNAPYLKSRYGLKTGCDITFFVDIFSITDNDLRSTVDMVPISSFNLISSVDMVPITRCDLRSVVDIVSDHFYPMSIWKLEEMSAYTTEVLRYPFIQYTCWLRPTLFMNVVFANGVFISDILVCSHHRKYMLKKCMQGSVVGKFPQFLYNLFKLTRHCASLRCTANFVSVQTDDWWNWKASAK